ncbi:transposase [Streptomyces aureoversilis]|uniref:Transposase n=1 Tax=Streptomyces aureoversilis TaxID=67277 RepID=A0ABW0AEA1_9ACTN
MLTDAGAVMLAVPRDRDGLFEPQLVTRGGWRGSTTRFCRCTREA